MKKPKYPFEPMEPTKPIEPAKSAFKTKVLKSIEIIEYTEYTLDSFAELLKNNKYKLPITIHSFDGKSIRSSIGIKDYELAKQIEIYNLSVVKSNVKKSLFKTDKKLWVPILLDHGTHSNKSVAQFAKAHKTTEMKASFAVEKEGGRTQYLAASMGGTKLVADRKLSISEIKALEERKNSNR